MKYGVKRGIKTVYTVVNTINEEIHLIRNSRSLQRVIFGLQQLLVRIRKYKKYNGGFLSFASRAAQGGLPRGRRQRKPRDQNNRRVALDKFVDIFVLFVISRMEEKNPNSSHSGAGSCFLFCFVQMRCKLNSSVFRTTEFVLLSFQKKAPIEDHRLDAGCTQQQQHRVMIQI